MVLISLLIIGSSCEIDRKLQTFRPGSFKMNVLPISTQVPGGGGEFLGIRKKKYKTGFKKSNKIN